MPLPYGNQEEQPVIVTCFQTNKLLWCFPSVSKCAKKLRIGNYSGKEIWAYFKRKKKNGIKCENNIYHISKISKDEYERRAKENSQSGVPDYNSYFNGFRCQ